MHESWFSRRGSPPWETILGRRRGPGIFFRFGPGRRGGPPGWGPFGESADDPPGAPPFGGPPFGGPPFGGPPPFGPPFGGRRRGRRFSWPPFGRGPKVRRGDVRAAALALLAEQPRNGYQIIQEIGERSGGLWRPSSGSVYPALQQLEDEGLVQVETQDGRRVFALTEAGRAYVEAHKEELAAPWEAVAAGVDDTALELGSLIAQVGMAAFQVSQAGNAAQRARARQTLIETRRALYQILAEDEADSPD